MRIKKFKVFENFLHRGGYDNGLWDYTPEDAAEEIWAVMKPKVHRAKDAARSNRRTYYLQPRLIMNKGCEILAFEPTEEIKPKLLQLVKKEIDKSIDNNTLDLDHVRYKR